MRNFNGDANVRRSTACTGKHPVQQLTESLPGMGKSALPENRALRVQYADLMRLGAPVNPRKNEGLRFHRHDISIF